MSALALAIHLLAAPAIAAGGFEFAGFHLGIDLNTLRASYPMSHHEFWAQPSGRIFTPDDPARFRALLAGDTGTFVLRVSQRDLVEDVFYVQADVEQGRIRRLVLRFEIPDELRATRRGPPCDAVRRKLTERYGWPARSGPGWYEETVHHWPVVWERAGETLVWDCGEYAIVIRPA
jgi:hypothetical protein